jgi:hypothetical protein
MATKILAVAVLMLSGANLCVAIGDSDARFWFARVSLCILGAAIAEPHVFGDEDDDWGAW